MDVLFVHGYNVTTTKTYGVLPQRLKAAGHRIKDVYLGKYVTLDDDITMRDLTRAFHAALVDLYGDKLSKVEFGCITHSTGGLVVRSWISEFYGDAMSKLPLTHLIMLAPPTSGSRLAELGKSRLSRLRNLVGIEPGIQVLNALELGSSFQWQLNSHWMQKKLHAAPGFYPFVITGEWIDKKLWDVIVPATYERGSDGVVRASAANLNMQKVTILPDGKVQREVMGGVPYLIPPQVSHSDTRFGIMGSIPAKGDHPVLTAILECLSVASKSDYQNLEAEFATRTTMLQREGKFYDGSTLDRYSQLVFRVVDSAGTALSDFAVELMDADKRGDQLPAGFFADRHKNDVHPEFFVYYLDYDRLSKIKEGRLGFRVRTAANTTLIAYDDSYYLDASSAQSILRPNQTTLIEVVMRRRINKNVFQLTKDLNPHNITGKAGPDWID